MSADHSEESQFLPGFIAILELLEPYLDSLVLTGGWVPYLYHYHLKRMNEERAPLTEDIDFLTPGVIPVEGKDIDTILRESGLECKYRSRDTPPLTVYAGKIGDHAAEVEFLTHAPGQSEDVVTVQPGLTAQSLHYLDLLNEFTWVVEIDMGEERKSAINVLLPTPGAFVVHKGIVYRKRRADIKRAKDLFYLFHILAIYGEEWKTWISDDLHKISRRFPTWYRKMWKNLQSDLSGEDDDDIRAIVNQRPADFLVELNDDQLAQYVLETVRRFIDSAAREMD